MTHGLTEYIGLAGVTLSVVAIWLHWGLGSRIADLEDGYKEGALTGEQLASALRRARLLPVACTLLGASLLIGAVVRWVG